MISYTKDTFSDYSDVVSVRDIMKILGVGRTSVLKLLQEDKIKSVRVGMKYIIPKNSVIDYMSKKQSQTCTGS